MLYFETESLFCTSEHWEPGPREGREETQWPVGPERAPASVAQEIWKWEGEGK